MSMCGCENSLWRVYWGLQLRFFGQLCSSAKVHTIVEGQSIRTADKHLILLMLVHSCLTACGSFQFFMSVRFCVMTTETQKALSEGYAVVIGLQSTGESSMAHQFARELEGEPAAKRARGETGAAAASSSRKKAELPSLFKEMLLRFIGTNRTSIICHARQKGWQAFAKTKD